VLSIQAPLIYGMFIFTFSTYLFSAEFFWIKSTLFLHIYVITNNRAKTSKALPHYNHTGKIYSNLIGFMRKVNHFRKTDGKYCHCKENLENIFAMSPRGAIL